jgi:hypothetical protein
LDKDSFKRLFNDKIRYYKNNIVYRQDQVLKFDKITKNTKTLLISKIKNMISLDIETLIIYNDITKEEEFVPYA